MNKVRLNRKREHLSLAMQRTRCSFTALFNDIHLPHNCLTTVNPDDTDLTADICGIKVRAPLYINAITGGALSSESVNRRLAMLAKKYALPMAVGSQAAGLKHPGLAFTYRVARKYNPQGVLIANLPAAASLQQARSAVAMLDAQILQLFLNPAQELVMAEGDPLEEGLLDNIAAVCAGISVPVIIKEVGFGIDARAARSLAAAGVSAIDVGGRGGTNFAWIEGRRNPSSWWKPFTSWGLPTPVCVADVVYNGPGIQVLASGGVDDGLRALKCLCLGAAAVGTAGGILRQLRKGFAQADRYLEDYLRQLRVGMALLGVKTLPELAAVPLAVTGRFRELIEQRGIDPLIYAQRGN
ncbi:MAG TPA: type 2 isopentenyl-diphosphate Delta-isomerase [Bacillota bacterium]|nr:type 2 isopentenyl-diphosphate Delta-isomerase [Bacillota bacterium]HPZ21524.1 type 2 isopentenyl-diphosphate Delta-isomerase [Bacillota bacterium]HQD19609.1 type 2 isopentenyl-diphosphate Delta-isomerase [Bacillota bacterium]